MKEHFLKGHINFCIKDQDQYFTDFGKHDRVVGFFPQNGVIMARVDSVLGLGNPSEKQILKALRSGGYLRGKATIKEAARRNGSIWYDVKLER